MSPARYLAAPSRETLPTRARAHRRCMARVGFAAQHDLRLTRQPRSTCRVQSRAPHVSCSEDGLLPHTACRGSAEPRHPCGGAWSTGLAKQFGVTNGIRTHDGRVTASSLRPLGDGHPKVLCARGAELGNRTPRAGPAAPVAALLIHPRTLRTDSASGRDGFGRCTLQELRLVIVTLPGTPRPVVSLAQDTGGGRGIRTLEAGFCQPPLLAGECLKPLDHASMNCESPALARGAGNRCAGARGPIRTDDFPLVRRAL